MEAGTSNVLIALIEKLTPTQVLVVLAVIFLTYLYKNIMSQQDKKMRLRNFVRAEIDATIFEFNTNIGRLNVEASEKKLLILRFELLARTYLMDESMSMLLKNGFKKYGQIELDNYCTKTGTHIRNELLRRLFVYEHEYPNILKIDKGERLKTTMAIYQYTACAKFYIRLHKPWWRKRAL